jgi:hypothetical protein
MVTDTKRFIFLKQEYSKARDFFMGIRYVHYATYYTIHITLTLCITISCNREGAVFCVLGHFAMSSLLPCLGPTDSHCPLLGDRGPLPPKWRPLSQDPHTLPPHSSEQIHLHK